MKAEKGDLIRVAKAYDEDYKEGEIMEVAWAWDDIGVYVTKVHEDGSNIQLYNEEYVIHRKAGEEDFDGEVGACASCGAELVDGITWSTYDTKYDASDEQIRSIIEEDSDAKAEYPPFPTFSPNGLFPNEPQDAVNSPNHYTQGKFETIEIIEQITSGYDDGFTAHCIGTATKYIARAPFKHDTPLEDLRKAAKYLEFAIERLDAKSTQ